MKKRLTALLTAIICMTGMIGATSVKAASSSEPEFMVIGIDYDARNLSEISQYVVTPIFGSDIEDFHVGEPGMISSGTVQLELGDVELQIGDVLTFDGGYEVAEVIPVYYYPVRGENYPDVKIAELVYLGNATDVYGEEFESAIRTQTAAAQAKFQKTVYFNDLDAYYSNVDWGGVTVHWGDANEDEEIDILDCITLNKNLLGSYDLTKYAGLIADVNMDGKLDSTDSLCILKEVVGLTKDYQPVGEQTAE